VAPPTRTPRSAWIDAGLQALAGGGPDAVRIDPLAKSLGVTRGGFYWHFSDRGALLDEMLDTWERRMVDEVIERIDAGGGDARDRLWTLWTLAGSLGLLFTIELAVRDWARRDETVADRLRRVDNRRVDYLRRQFRAFCSDEDDVEARCLLVMTLWIGNHFVAADHEGRSRADVTKLALRQLVA
jgi:AcrR family transcriptional regulator